MFLGMQDFDFAKSNKILSKSNHFCSNFDSILLKFRLKLAQICPNLTNVAQKSFAGGMRLHPPSYTALICDDFLSLKRTFGYLILGFSTELPSYRCHYYL